jgi:hypothetical protein
LEEKISGRRLLKGENKLLKGELLKGGLLKGKELVKKNCYRGIARKSEGRNFMKAQENMVQCKFSPRTLYIGFRKAKLKKS